MKAPRGQVGYAVVRRGWIVVCPFTEHLIIYPSARHAKAWHHLRAGETIRRIRLQVPEGEHE